MKDEMYFGKLCGACIYSAQCQFEASRGNNSLVCCQDPKHLIWVNKFNLCCRKVSKTITTVIYTSAYRAKE
jgi:hypothetical protein